MKRLLTLVVATLFANAVALIAANVLLDKVSLGWQGFLAGLLIFTVVVLVLEPIIRRVADDKAPAIVGLSSLIATLVSLVIVVIVSDSLSISGPLTWLMAAGLVWIVSALIRFVIIKVAEVDVSGRPEDA